MVGTMQTGSATDKCAETARTHAQEERPGRGGQDAAAKAVPEEAHARLEAAVLIPLMAQLILLAALAPRLQHKAETGRAYGSGTWQCNPWNIRHIMG